MLYKQVNMSLLAMLFSILLAVMMDTLIGISQGRAAKVRYVCPLNLQLAFLKASYTPESVEFTLKLTNCSDKPLIADTSMHLGALIYPDVRDYSGRIINIIMHNECRPPVTTTEFSELAPGSSLSRTYRWSKYFQLPSSEMGPLRIRFAYRTDYVSIFAREHGIKVWEGSVLSNTVVLDVKEGAVRVLGDWHELEPELRVSFLKPGYRLLKVYAAQRGQPAEAFLNLIAAKGGDKRTIIDSQDLEGIVHINSREDALSFVRLFTSLDTHYLFKNLSVVEVFKDEEIPDETYGVICTYWWDELKLKPVRVTQEGSDFLIERNLIAYPDPGKRKARLYRSLERVTPTGKYEHKVAKVILKSDFWDEPSIYLPYY